MTIQSTTITVSLELLEDLHTGNGLGTHLIDSLQSKDKNLQPVIWRQHIKGLLVAASKIINNLNNKYHQHFNALLNDSPNSNCTFVLGSFYATKLKASPTHILSSTAREGIEYKNNQIDNINRAPKQGSLRTQEYIKAGSEFCATWRLLCDEQDSTEYIAALTVLVKHLDHIGASRNRGSGRVKCNIETERTQIPSTDAATDSIEKQSLTITLSNLEPLRLPNTDVPGNIIPTDTYISGERLKSALANWCLLQGNKTLFEALVNDKISVGYAYPSINCKPFIPAPLCIQTQKPSASGTLPWWAEQTSGKHFIDRFDDNAPEISGLKRLKGHYYFQLESQTLIEQGVAIHMRNKVRTQFNATTDDSELFSEEVLPEQTQFMAKLTSNDKNKGLLAELAYLIKADAWPLLLGRGKAPCELTVTTDTTPAFIFNQNLPITLILTAPLLCYCSDTGQPHTQLEQALNQLCPKLQLEQGDYLAVSEQDRLTGFSFETGLPKTPIQVIAAGSCIKVSNIEKASLLEDNLRQVNALGERQAQGLGQFALTQQSLTATLNELGNPSPEHNHIEQQLEDIHRLIDSEKARLLSNEAPSITQWQKLKTKLKQQNSIAEPRSLSNILQALQTQENKSKLNWLHIKTFLSKLDERCEQRLEQAILACDCILVVLATSRAEQGEQA